MKTHEVIELASSYMDELPGHIFDVLSISKPSTIEAAINLSKIVSKLSPIIGNLIEFNMVEFLNGKDDFHEHGEWKRQDPGFPDTIFEGTISPTPGIEIKAWFPLATEITARFKDSQNHFLDDQTYVCMLAWLPEHLIWGRPKIVGVCVVSGLSVASARDNHYHNPPDYLVLEPEDTKQRTRNLQQTNTNGYKWQGTPEQFDEAQSVVRSWGNDSQSYKPTPDYQAKIRKLIARYPYRLDTNFAKMDRIAHKGIELFKQEVISSEIHGISILNWSKLIASRDQDELIQEFRKHLNIVEED